MNTMSQRQKSVITYIMLVGCICVHIGESSVTKGVLPLFSDTFDKVRIRDWQPKQLFLYPGFAFGNLSGSLVLWNMWHAAAQFPFVSLFSAETTGPIFAKILRYSGISGALKSCIYKALYHFIYESQNDGSAEFAIFFTKSVVMATSLEISEKEVQIDHLHPKVFIWWKIVRIGPADPEIRGKKRN